MKYDIMRVSKTGGIQIPELQGTITCDPVTMVQQKVCDFLESLDGRFKFYTSISKVELRSTSTNKTNCKMPENCFKCDVENPCGDSKYNTFFCHAALFRHFANL